MAWGFNYLKFKIIQDLEIFAQNLHKLYSINNLLRIKINKIESIRYENLKFLKINKKVTSSSNYFVKLKLCKSELYTRVSGLLNKINELR